jgi:acetyltransferase-like isoleucine patch superfamily enzyme
MNWLRSVGPKIVGYTRRQLLVVMSNERRIRTLRRRGVRIGENCLVAGRTSFSSEPYLIEIGDSVAISIGCQFITHDASIRLFRAENPEMDVFGPIKIGSNVFFGTNCTVLPNSTIGSDCIIGSGSVVRGAIPDGSVVFGNPAKVVMKTALMKHLLINHKHRLDTHRLPPERKEEAIRRHFGLALDEPGR